MEDITVFLGKKIKRISVKKVSSFGKISGLMFRSRETDTLLFEFDKSKKRSFHSWFVFFPFLVLWIDEYNQVLEVRKIKPFTTTILPSKQFKKVIEIPFSRRNKDIISFFIGDKKI